MIWSFCACVINNPDAAPVLWAPRVYTESMRPLAARLTELTSWWQLHSAAVWSMNTMGGLFLHFAPLRVFCFCISNNICNESSVWIFMHFLKLNYSMKVNMQRRNLHRYSYPHTDYHICISLIMTKISFMSHSLYFAHVFLFVRNVGDSHQHQMSFRNTFEFSASWFAHYIEFYWYQGRKNMKQIWKWCTVRVHNLLFFLPKHAKNTCMIL